MKQLFMFTLLVSSFVVHAEAVDFETLYLSSLGACVAVTQATTFQDIQFDYQLMVQDIADSGFDFRPDALCRYQDAKPDNSCMKVETN